MLENSPRKFVVVARAQSGAFFGLGDALLLLDYPSNGGPLRIEIGTRRAHDPEFKKLLPLGLYAEITGSADDINAALRQFSEAARSVCQFITLVSNAATEDVVPELAIETTHGVTTRDFFQQKVEGEKLMLRERRRVHPYLVASLITRAAESPESPRLGRAIAHYHRAVQSCGPGLETIAMHHLWIASECLTQVAIRQSGKTRSELAAEWNVDERQVEPEVRKRLLFNGDEESYKAAKKATDGFEHGYLAFADVLQHALSAHSKLFAHVRSSLLRLIGCDGGELEVLTAKPYSSPADLTVAQYVRGKLIGDRTTLNDLAAPSEEYPRLDWINKFTEAADGGVEADDPNRFSANFAPILTPKLADGVTLANVSYEIWGTGESPAFGAHALVTHTRKASSPARKRTLAARLARRVTEHRVWRRLRLWFS